MKRIEFHAVIKFLKQGETPHIIMEQKMSSFYGDSCLGKSMIYKWHSLFKQGRDSIEEDQRSGRSIEATSSEIVEKVEKLVFEDPRLKKKQTRVSM
ncbi:unnamed protein product [Euphydryas editha]|uniref:Transposase n=1 Tax=Euphydryas editha TaxID=104508 RepID=A0AAU9UCG2_EUPED|nr:unnamed protein product [Euphydryas editha]